MMLVCMDLVSGYLLYEAVAEDRSYDTWHALVAARLEAQGTGVLSLVSDRAKALIKLAETGLECRSVPDLFHRIHELVKSYALAIGSRLRQARQAFSQAQEPLSQGQTSSPSSAEAQQVHALVEASAAEVTRWEKVHSAYRYHLATVSLIVHPWDLVDSTRQTSAAMKRQLHAETRALEALIETNGLPVKKKAWTRSASSLLACRPWWTFGGRRAGKFSASGPDTEMDEID
jgi:hypothetical protein